MNIFNKATSVRRSSSIFAQSHVFERPRVENDRSAVTALTGSVMITCNKI